MKVSIDTLNKRLPAVIKALGRRESIVVSHQGKDLALLQPLPDEPEQSTLRNHPACGMWADRDDMADPVTYVRKIRKGRVHGV